MKTQQEGYVGRHEIDDRAADFYREQGYLVVHDAVSDEGVRTLLDEAVSVCRQERGPIRCEFRSEAERDAFPSPEQFTAMTEDEVLQHFLCIHQAHKCSKLIRHYLAHRAIVEVLTRVIGPNVKCMQSMLFIKSAGKPGQAWHQDEDFIPTRDRSLAGAWMALDDAAVDNGCLWVIPGSHKPGILWPMYAHDDPQFDCNLMSYDFPYRDEDAVPVEVPAGAIVFFNGYLLHRSLPNTRKSGYRRVLVNHYMSAESLLPWHVQEGEPIARMDFRDIVMVAGEDPYAWKGTARVVEPHVRAAGQGGCGDGRVDLATHKRNLAEAAT